MPATFRVSQQFAIHEMGKALVATVLRQAREAQGLKPRLERVERVSIVPRGRCAPMPEQPRNIYSPIASARVAAFEG